MKGKLGIILASVCTLAMVAICAAPVRAQQMSEEHMKPTLYCYVSFWNVPRPMWADMLKLEADSKADMDKLIANGTITDYGNDEMLVHQVGQPTHSDWMCSHSMGNLAAIAAQYVSDPKQPAVLSASKHSDIIVESHDYNGQPGTFTDGYSRVSYWKLKPDAPDGAVEMLSRGIFVPLLEKLLADGAIHNYGVYAENIHTSDPGAFWVVFTSAGPDGLDKFNSAVEELIKQHPMAAAAFGSVVDESAHRDSLSRVINEVSK